MTDITEIQENAQKRQQEVLNMIEALSDTASSDKASSVRKIYYFWGMAITFLQISRIYSGPHNRYIVPPVSLNNVVLFISQLQLNLITTIGTKDLSWPGVRTFRHPQTFWPGSSQDSNFGSRWDG
jgi:hypothetical protein